MTLTIAPAEWATSTTAAMSASTSASRPDLSAPIWMTMSSSVAPSPSARTRLEDLGLGPVVAVREADRRADRDVRPGRGWPPHAATSAGRTQTDATSYAGGQPAAGLDERVVELRPKQRVVDRLGDVALGQVVDGEGHGLT